MNRIGYPESVSVLIEELRNLPSIGPRGAERIVLSLLSSSKEEAQKLNVALSVAIETIRSCEDCGFFSESELCSICRDGKREEHLFCVVEGAADILPIERAGVFRGKYHCLGGKLSPLDNIKPEDLRINSLLKRVKEQSECEVIIALGADVEGEATTNYLFDLLQKQNCKVTRLAQGLPAGVSLAFADELTLTHAFVGRQ